MNVYLHVEISARELDSKLLLAVVAACRGHQVMLADRSTLLRGVANGSLMPGVYHTKALTPSDTNLRIHGDLVNRGFLVTSIDEEAGLFDHGYANVARARYSSKSMAQAAAVFAWGQEDANTLKTFYPEHESRIFETGSPRADLWSGRMNSFWPVPETMPDKPFLLVSSNLSVNEAVPLHERIRFDQQAGYFARDPSLLGKHFASVAEDSRLNLTFLEAIHRLANEQNDFEIVVRPHPKEIMEAWRVYLEGVPNVRVLREGSITPWVEKAFAVMQNGCTTAIEAIMKGTPLISWVPFERQTRGNLANQLGTPVSTIDELSSTVRAIYETAQTSGSNEILLPEAVSRKVSVDTKELAAQKMVSIWESLEAPRGGQSHWRRFETGLRLKRFGRRVRSSLRWVAGRRAPTKETEDEKFPPVQEKAVKKTVDAVRKTLGFNQHLDVRILDERAILIRPKLMR